MAAAVLAAATVAAASAWWWASAPARRRARAEAADRAGDFTAARAAWRAVNAAEAAAGAPRAAHLRAEARADLALGRAAEAERVLAAASGLDPADPEPWRLRLERLRLLDRPLEALELGRVAVGVVPPGPARRGVLRDLTLALLADLPDDLARATLARWADADPSAPDPDPDARVALLRRFAASPHSGDPDRAARIAELTGLVAADPGRLTAREALAAEWLDAGEPARARATLDGWPGPEAGRDARYWRLLGRIALDHDRAPARAAAAFARALEDLPHDWKTRVRLARALHALGREADARREAEAVARLREALDPARLGPRLSAALARPDDPAALNDLADLCDRAGLSSLAAAWRREADAARAPVRNAVSPSTGATINLDF